jgi:hypothetical protein
MNSMLKQLDNFDIKALVDSKNPILQMYLKRFGFKIEKKLPREENAGELYFEIKRPKKISRKDELKKAA